MSRLFVSLYLDEDEDVDVRVAAFSLDFRRVSIYSDNMIFAWGDRNREHLAKHRVSPEEAEDIIISAQPPYPMEVGDEKLVVWGQTHGGRYLQVIFVLKPAQDVEYESLSIEDWLEVESGRASEIVRVIHAMDLTPAMKKRLHKRRR